MKNPKENSSLLHLATVILGTNFSIDDSFSGIPELGQNPAKGQQLQQKMRVYLIEVLNNRNYQNKIHVRVGVRFR